MKVVKLKDVEPIIAEKAINDFADWFEDAAASMGMQGDEVGQFCTVARKYAEGLRK